MTDPERLVLFFPLPFFFFFFFLHSLLITHLFHLPNSSARTVHHHVVSEPLFETVVAPPGLPSSQPTVLRSWSIRQPSR